MQKHKSSIPDNALHYSSMASAILPNDHEHSTTINVYAPPTCEAKPNGVACFRHAEIEYHTTAWRDFPSETRWLCKLHGSRLEDGTQQTLIARYAPLVAELQERQVPA